MIFAITIAEKLLAGLAKIGASAADSSPSVETRAASAADFANTLNRLDQSGGAAKPQHGAHTAPAGSPSVAG